jgi:TRAP-type C4-dicarboxylate transport system substrate-binding protein
VKAIRAGAVALALIAPAAHAADPITLKLAFPPPPVSFYNTGVLAPWSKEIEDETKGALKVQIFVGPSLANLGNMYDRILNGVADLGWALHGPFGAQFQKTSVTQLPGELGSGVECTQALWQLFTQGIIADEYTAVKTLSISCFPPTSFLSPKPLRSIDDFKGLKISVGSRLVGQGVELLGAAPIALTTTEIYPSLQRGTVDAAVIGWAATAAFKLHEVARYYFEAPMGMATNFLLMNKESFAKLPEELRRVLDAKSGAPLTARMGKAGDEETQHGRKMVAAMQGHTITTMPTSDLPRIKQAMAPLVDQWIKETPDGARVLAAFKAEFEKARRGM